MALLLWSWFLFSVERENSVGCCEVRQVGGYGKPWDPAVQGQKPAGEGGQLVRGHEAHPLQLDWGLHVGAGEGLGMVCASVLSVPLAGGWGRWGSMEGSGAWVLA